MRMMFGFFLFLSDIIFQCKFDFRKETFGGQTSVWNMDSAPSVILQLIRLALKIFGW